MHDYEPPRSRPMRPLSGAVRGNIHDGRSTKDGEPSRGSLPRTGRPPTMAFRTTDGRGKG
jgi:hypothetical protein